MPPNEKNVLVLMSSDDALLLQGSLRNYRWTFAQARNEVMTGLLDRVELALGQALADAGVKR